MSIPSGMGHAGIVAIPIPPNQLANYVLSKESAANYDMEWLPPPTIANPLDGLYVRGSDPETGSLRIVPGLITGAIRLEEKTTGVWNTAPIEIDSGTLHLGLNLDFEAGGDWVRIRDADRELDSLLPSTPFDEGGTITGCLVPVVDIHKTNIPVQPDFSVDNVATVHGSANAPTSDVLGTSHRMKTGAVAATEEVMVAHYRGTDNTGTLFSARNFPASKFPANTEVTIELRGMLSALDGEQIYTEFTSEAPFSVLGDSEGNPYTTWDFHNSSVEEVLTNHYIVNDEMDLLFTDEADQLVWGAF